MTPKSEFAPAKVNLTLHVTGQRTDGYHLLDSLVMFADIGDQITFDPAEATSLKVQGPYADGVPIDASNLVLKAAALMDADQGRFTLTKNLPAASGIGGGSADAAATLRLLHRVFDRSLPERLHDLGADIPACLRSRTLRMKGIGDDLQDLPDVPGLWAILVNPGVEVSTPLVFKGLSSKTNTPHPTTLPGFASADDLTAWLCDQRNDLEPPAIGAQPIIQEVLSDISALPDCQLARMSGSGATCFGLFPSEASAILAALLLGQENPDWWVIHTRLGNPAS